ncbi:hypothetical protein ES319_A11G249300v1 [Gossypium barbadense]|uniref:Uncharacterized protein n=1 Tax=Gossypium barbadense TaxID=3634 RepID=A0A5J5TXH4_GOSBA|nr:hypothetical protein ES319_A11G249300v1 [Gossypium barbadense]
MGHSSVSVSETQLLLPAPPATIGSTEAAI